VSNSISLCLYVGLTTVYRTLQEEVLSGYFVSHFDGSNEKMKLLFYGLGTIPVELLLSECARLGRCDVDSWIPREIVPESFSGEHVLRLGLEGFTFHQQKANRPLKFFLLSRSVIWQDQMLLFLCDRPDDTENKWLVKAAMSSNRVSHANSKNG
jgi:hypothetical protein